MATMDPQRKKLIVAMVLQFACFIALFFTSPITFETHSSLQQSALFFIQNFVLEYSRGGSLQGRIQSHHRDQLYRDIDLVGSYSNIVFKRRFRMSKQTFSYVCQQVGPLIYKKDTNLRKAISIETRVAIAITRLASGSPLYIIADSYRVGVSTVHVIVLEF